MPVSLRKNKAFAAFAGSLILCLGFIGLASVHESNKLLGETTARTCGTIFFGASSASGGTKTSTSNFTTTNITVTSIDQSGVYSQDSSSGTYACRLNPGHLTFNFASTVITEVRVYAFGYDSGSTFKVTTSANTTGETYTTTLASAPTLTDYTDSANFFDFTTPDNGDGSASTTLTITNSSSSKNRTCICKILLTINGSSGSGSSSSSAGGGAGSSSSSVSSSTGTYELVTSSSMVMSGGVYAIADSKSAGSAGFLGTAVASSYYLANVSGTVNSDLTTTPASTMADLTLGGSSGAWTLSNGTSLLYGDSSYPKDLYYGEGTELTTWDISIDSSTNAATVKNVSGTYYLQHNTSYWDCSSSSASLYLFVKTGTVGQKLSSSLTGISVAAGSTDSSVSLTPSGFTGTPTYEATPLDSAVCLASVSGTTLTVTGLKAGSTTVTVTATNGSETASVTINVTVSGEAGAFVSVDKSSMSLVANRASGIVTASTHNFSSTPTYSAVSSSTGVATVSANSSTGAVTVSPLAEGTTTVTITAADGTSTATATCAVSVAATPVPTITLSDSSKTISVDGSSTVTGSATGYDDNSAVSYSASSSNTAVCTVSVTNNVITLTGVTAGTSTVTVTGSYTGDWGLESDTATVDVTVSTYTGTTTEYNPYRIAPVKAVGGSATVYDVQWNSSQSRYIATVAKTLNNSTDYTAKEDVAAYFEAFGTYPQNYSTNTTTVDNYSGDGRQVSTYEMGSYDGKSSNYAYGIPGRANMGSLCSGGTFYELDIAAAGSTSYGTGSNRGVLRVVGTPGGTTTQIAYPDRNWTSGYAPVCVYTGNHYTTFQEYYNYSSGFGTAYSAAGTTAFKGAVPTTITYQVS